MKHFAFVLAVLLSRTLIVAAPAQTPDDERRSFQFADRDLTAELLIGICFFKARPRCRSGEAESMRNSV